MGMWVLLWLSSVTFGELKCLYNSSFSMSKLRNDPVNKYFSIPAFDKFLYFVKLSSINSNSFILSTVTTKSTKLVTIYFFKPFSSFASVLETVPFEEFHRFFLDYPVCATADLVLTGFWYVFNNEIVYRFTYTQYTYFHGIKRVSMSIRASSFWWTVPYINTHFWFFPVSLLSFAS